MGDPLVLRLYTQAGMRAKLCNHIVVGQDATPSHDSSMRRSAKLDLVVSSLKLTYQ